MTLSLVAVARSGPVPHNALNSRVIDRLLIVPSRTLLVTLLGRQLGLQLIELLVIPLEEEGESERRNDDHDSQRQVHPRESHVRPERKSGGTKRRCGGQYSQDEETWQTNHPMDGHK